ncbi:hypothetical protein [Patiriisocius sp. Uisw_017]|uniref:hypothetical protein n=1 Tax=Patiriisocius sp. Uisw_017 TaxID=3230968 RepID=UPI0039E94696
MFNNRSGPTITLNNGIMGIDLGGNKGNKKEASNMNATSVFNQYIISEKNDNFLNPIKGLIDSLL